MVDMLRSLKKRSNDKQKEYLANAFVVSGGAMMFTAWQEIFPLCGSIQSSLCIGLVFLIIMIMSSFLVYFGYNMLENVCHNDIT